jgi:5-methylcytosine-specific restriction endonuclease McrA
MLPERIIIDCKPCSTDAAYAPVCRNSHTLTVVPFCATMLALRESWGLFICPQRTAILQASCSLNKNRQSRIAVLCVWYGGGHEMPKAVDGMKQCTACREVKPVSAFYLDRASPDGLAYQCKPCHRIVARRWKAAHRTEVIAKHKEWRHANPEKMRQYGLTNRERNREALRVRKKVYRETHREQVRAQEYAWVRANRDWVRAKSREYQARHPEVRRMKVRQRRARVKGAGGTIPVADWKNLLISLGSRCLCCGATGHLTLDHVIPLARGGTHTIDNAQPLCKSCNCRKQHRFVFDWRPYPEPLRLAPDFKVIWR